MFTEQIQKEYKMPYLRSFYKISFTGRLGTTEEIFNTSLHASTFTDNLAYEDWDKLTPTVLDDIYDAFGAFWSNGGARIPSQWILESVKVAWININGEYITAPKEVQGQTLPGGSTGYGYAPQLALACTLVSNKWKDPGKYNRMYIPTIGHTNADGRFTTGERDAVQEPFTTMIQDMNDALSPIHPDIAVAVVSNNNLGGYTGKAVSTMVGRVIDTQRRRRNKLVEDYQVLPI